MPSQTIIVGAGLSGLSAAKILKESKKDILVLEARNRVGGRTYTVHDPIHGKADLGGAYVGPTQDNVFQLAEEYGLKFYNVNDKEKTVLNFTNHWFKYSGVIPPVSNPLIIMDLNNAIRTLEAMASQVPKHAPWMAEKAAEWDSQTVKEYINKMCWTQFTKDGIDAFIRAVFCVEPHEISLLSSLWYIHNGGGVSKLTDITNGAQEKKFVGGSQQLSSKIADSLGDCLKLSSPVVHIKQSDSGVELIDKEGKQYNADYVILAIPPSLLSKITFDPPLPGDKRLLIQRMPMGSIIKTIMYYEEPFWKKLDMCGSAVSSSGPVCYCMDDTKPDGTHPAIMGFILANQARHLMYLTKEERREALCKHYAKTFKCDKFLQPIGYLEHNWIEEEFSGGCYTSVLPPGVLSTMFKCLREPFGRVHFAGTETATKWSGYMDGAIQAGYRAGREVLHRLEGKGIPAIEQEATMVIKRDIVETWLPSITSLLWSVAVAVFGIMSYYFFQK